jgi:predicted acylesterase/phospholipase RssA
VDNLPVELAREMGGKYIIASDVSKRGKMEKRPENIFEILLSMFYIMQARGALADRDTCDCYIRPDVSMYSSWSFSNTDKVLEAGHVAAEEMLPMLKKALKL